MTISFEGRRAVVTGANRGLGLEFTRQILSAGGSVFALSRDPRCDGLAALATAHPDKLTTARLDVADTGLIDAAHEAVAASWKGVDVLINNAGAFGTRDAHLGSVEDPEIERIFEINTLGPLRMARRFLDLLRHGKDARLVNVTSLMGSIQDNTSGGAWSYRISKAALNMVTRNLGHELKPLGIVCVAMHPGWVKTDMGGQRAPLEANEAVASMLDAIEGLDAGASGLLVDRHGEKLPW